MTPLLLAAVGGLFTEKAGMLNIGLEGLMLVGSFFSVLAAGSSGSLALGILAGVSSSMLLALLFGLSCLKLKANLFIAGIATNLMGAGLTSLLASFFFGHKGVHRFPVFPELLKISPPVWSGVLGEILLGHSGLVYAGWAAVIIAYIILNKTVLGLRLKGTGFDNRTVKSLGLNPDFYRLLAFLISGFCCGLAGTFLSFNLEAFVPNGTAGRGWIALVIIYLGGRKPGGILLAAILFALAESLSNHLQGTLSIPNRLILALPYIISVIALIIYSVWGHYRKRLC